MSYDESDEEGEWEVVDIVHTTTSIKPDKKDKPAKKEDVDKLAQDIQSMLSLKSTHDSQQILLLEQKMKQQQRLSEQQLATIQQKLAELTAVQLQQDRTQKDLDKQRRQLEQQQRQQLLEQQIKLESLSEHQILTQKQLNDAHQQIKKTQQVTQNVTDNIQSLQQLRAQQDQFNLQQMSSLHPMVPLGFNKLIPPPPPQMPDNSNPLLNNNSNLTNNNNSNNHASNGSNNAASNGWLPSFLMFGNGNNNATTNLTTNANTGAGHTFSNGVGATPVVDMDLQPHSPSLPPSEPEEKEPMLLMSNFRSSAQPQLEQDQMDDDDEVLKWSNDYGDKVPPLRHPLSDNPQWLKTKGHIGEGKFSPGEKRQCGWVLRNTSNTLLKVSAQLACIGGEQQPGCGISVEAEKEYEFSLQPSEEVYILVEVTAPSICGKYAAFYQLMMRDGTKIGQTLEVLCHVVSTYTKERESKIEKVIKMGFSDRAQVVATLKKHKWNLQAAVDALLALGL